MHLLIQVHDLLRLPVKTMVLTSDEIDLYLQRIGFPITRPEVDLAPTKETLFLLHRCHLTAIKFDNSAIFHGEPTTYTIDAVFDRMVTQRRGEICVGHALLFQAVVAYLGYEVDIYQARVVVERAYDDVPATHLVPVVTLPNNDRITNRKTVGERSDRLATIGEQSDRSDRYLCDLGFGGAYRDLFIEPIQLTANQDVPGHHTIVHHPTKGEYVVIDQRQRFSSEPKPLYHLIDRPCHKQDIALIAWFLTTSPDSRVKRSIIHSVI